MPARWILPGGTISVASKLSFRALHIQDTRFKRNEEDRLSGQVSPNPPIEKKVNGNAVC